MANSSSHVNVVDVDNVADEDMEISTSIWSAQRSNLVKIYNRFKVCYIFKVPDMNNWVFALSPA